MDHLVIGTGEPTSMPARGLVLGQSAFHSGREASLALGTLAFLAVLAVALLAAPFIGHHLSPRVTAITRRLMGMILAAIAMEMMVRSLQAFFPGLT